MVHPGQATRIRDVSMSVQSFEHELDIVHSMTWTNGGVSSPEEAAKAAYPLPFIYLLTLSPTEIMWHQTIAAVNNEL
jgi:hypothetical protein